MEIYPPKTVCGCLCGGIIKRWLHMQSLCGMNLSNCVYLVTPRMFSVMQFGVTEKTVTHAVTLWNAFVSVQLPYTGWPPECSVSCSLYNHLCCSGLSMCLCSLTVTCPCVCARLQSLVRVSVLACNRLYVCLRSLTVTCPCVCARLKSLVRVSVLPYSHLSVCLCSLAIACPCVCARLEWLVGVSVNRIQCLYCQCVGHRSLPVDCITLEHDT